MRSSKITTAVVLLIVAVFAFLYSLFVIEPHLVAHYQQIAFQSDWLFLKNYLGFAGGFGEYVSTFLAQFFYSDVIGSLFIAVSGLLCALFLLALLKLRRKDCFLTLTIAPVFQLILLVLQTNYRYPFSITIDILLSLIFVFLAFYLSKKLKVVSWIGFILLGIFTYVFCGGASFLIYAFTYLLLTVNGLKKQFVIQTAPLLAVTFLIPYIAFRFFYYDSLYDAFFKAIPYSPTLLIYKKSAFFYLAMCYVPVSLLLVSILDFIFTKSSKKVKRLNWYAGVQVGLVVVALLFTGFTTGDEKNKASIQVDYEASKHNWDKVVDLALQSQVYDRMVNFQYNRALAHQHRLLDELFVYPQLLGIQALFVEEPFAGEVTLPSSDVYFDIGAIDEAEHYAFEAQTLLFYSPRVLKRLVEVSMIKGRYSAAETYLNVLENNVRERKWVQHYKNLLDDIDLIETDGFIQDKRNQVVRKDRLATSPLLRLHDLVVEKPENDMAFQYLLSYLLLDQKILESLPYLRFLSQAGYKKVPTCLEEAYILAKSLNPENKMLQQIPISKETIDRFNQFAKIKNQYANNKTAAQKALSKFSNTYWYYILFQSPKVTKVSLDTRVVK